MSKIGDVEDLTKSVDLLFDDIIRDLKDSKTYLEYESPEDYREKTGKRFRMTKDQKARGLLREEAFEEFLNL